MRLHPSVPYFLIIWMTGLSPASTDRSSKNLQKRNRTINAKLYDGFQELDAALLPDGSYIQYADIPVLQVNTTTPLPDLSSTSNLNSLINNIIGDQLGLDTRSRRRSVSESSKRWIAGIVPLRASALPMGIYIPEGMVLGRADDERSVRRKIETGIRKIFSKILRLALRRETFNYVRSFNGLSPLEPVFIPRGYFIPLSSIQTAMGNKTERQTNQSASMPGLEALNTVTLQGGIFIPRRMTELPDLPASLIPLSPIANSDNSNTGRVTTPPPEPDDVSFPELPDFQDPATITPSSARSPDTDESQYDHPEDGGEGFTESESITHDPDPAATTDRSDVPSFSPTSSNPSSTYAEEQLPVTSVIPAELFQSSTPSMEETTSLSQQADDDPNTDTTDVSNSDDNSDPSSPPEPFDDAPGPSSTTASTTHTTITSSTTTASTTRFSVTMSRIPSARPPRPINFSIFLPPNTPIFGYPARVNIRRDWV